MTVFLPGDVAGEGGVSDVWEVCGCGALEAGVDVLPEPKRHVALHRHDP